MLRRIILLALLIGGSVGADPLLTQDQAANDLFARFVTGYRRLKVPDFEMSYVSNFKKIPPAEQLARQADFFQGFRRLMRGIQRAQLSPELRYQYDEMKYAIDFQLDRIEVEKLATTPLKGEGGLATVPQGHRWYLLYIRRWASRPITPSQLLALGESELTRVTGEIQALQAQLGFAGKDTEFAQHLAEARFTIRDEARVKADLLELRDRVRKKLPTDFERVDFPAVDIKPWVNATKDTPPGYYDDGVFYYTFFNGGFPARARDWLFIHEADPGHHYQDVLGKERPPLRALFWYPGYSEGWGAYAEDLGRDLGCYSDPYQYLGKWEWDQVRSARVVLDVRIHDQGWSREKALQWWHERLPLQGDIAEREVDRVIRWPAQVVSYKVGEAEIWRLRALAQQRLGERFDLRKFHSVVLRRGSVPLPVLEEIVTDWIEGQL